MKEGKSFQISQNEVLYAYKAVKANKGAGGVDGVEFEEFDKDWKNRLYKLWNRMASGTYFPKSVRGVEIPKKNGKMRLLGIERAVNEFHLPHIMGNKEIQFPKYAL